MIKYICNNPVCRREVSTEDTNNSAISANEWLESVGSQHSLVLTTEGQNDIFCESCLPRAHTYWTSKMDQIKRLSNQWNSTVRNHCKKHFSAPNPVILEDVDVNQSVS